MGKPGLIYMDSLLLIMERLGIAVVPVNLANWPINIPETPSAIDIIQCCHQVERVNNLPF